MAMSDKLESYAWPAFGLPAGFRWKEGEVIDGSEKYVVVTVNSRSGPVVKPFKAVTPCDMIAYISCRYWGLWWPVRVWLLKWQYWRKHSGAYKSVWHFWTPICEENYSLVELTVLENGSLSLVWGKSDEIPKHLISEYVAAEKEFDRIQKILKAIRFAGDEDD